jgi:tRNA (guanine37-N1)-methyltransferase
MRFEIITIFPGFFAGFFEHGIVRRAQAEGLIAVAVHDLRAFTHDRHRTVDDRPFGGGEGMVLKPEPLARALEELGVRARGGGPVRAAETPSGAKAPLSGSETDVRAEARTLHESPDSGAMAAALRASGGAASGSPDSGSGATEAEDATDGPESLPVPGAGAETRVILLSAQGRPFTQAVARELAGVERVVLICGRYEGVDERINELYCDMELSIGDYVLSGGELAAAVVVDATMRLVPGVLGNEASGEFESFGVADEAITSDQEGVPRSQHGAGGLLDYPHYTRPADFAGRRVPEVLLNGDHLEIRRWRREQQLRKTLTNRPDLLEGAKLTAEDRKVLVRLRDEARAEKQARGAALESGSGAGLDSGN